MYKQDLMNVLFNCSTNVVGGGLKNSAFFIKKTVDDTTFNWHFAVCRPVYDLLQSWNVKLPEGKFTIFEKSPARNSDARKALLKICDDKKISMVYTMAGPAYVKFPCKHVQGISNAYITHADQSSFKLKGSMTAILRYYAYVFVQFLFSLRADYYLFQTQLAKDSYRKRSGKKEKNLFVVPNAFDASIKNYFESVPAETNRQDKVVRIFCPGAAYIHKGFQFIPAIIAELKKVTDVKFKFILTLPFDSPVWTNIEKELISSGNSEHCFNRGPFVYTEITGLLKDCEIVFVPSLLETFSASYLEAMCAGKKLIVADKQFAREICGDYAVYLNPAKPGEAAAIISAELTDINLDEGKKKLAEEILENYGSQDMRHHKIINVLKNIIA